MNCPDPLEVLRDRPDWEQAVRQLRSLISRHGDEARRRAEAYAHITGDVFVGRFARLRDKWLDPAPVFEDVQVKQFIGRAWLLEQLDAFLATHDRGHVVVQADAGLGKTALAAWLAHSRNWPCHFTRGRNGQVGLTALGNLAAQLIARYELGDQFAPQGMLPDTAGEPGWFEQVLQACADTARATGGHVVIVVDGLDEAEVVKGALPLGLPAIQSEGDRTRLLESYAPYLPEQRAELALRSAAGILDESYRGRVIHAIAPVIPESLLAEALDAASRISDADTRSRVIGSLAARLPVSLLGQALSLVQATTSESGGAQFLLGIAVRSAEPRHTELRGEALAMARSASDNMARAQALGDIAATLSGDERRQVLNEAVQAAKDNTYEYGRLYALDHLIRLAPTRERKQLISEAFTVARAMTTDIYWRAERLAALARYVPKPDRPAVLAEALADARSLAAEQGEPGALLNVAIAFPGDKRMDAFREFLAAAGEGGGLYPGVRLVVKIARILPDRLVVKVLELARKAAYEDSRLPEISRVWKIIPNQMIEECLVMLRKYPGGLQQAHGVGTAALYVPAPFSEQALGVALDAERKTVARRAILTQARLLWEDRITPAELETFRRVVADIRLDEYLDALAAALDIIAQTAGPQSLDDCLDAFRIVQRWWPPPAVTTDLAI